MDTISIVISGSGNMGRQVAQAAAADPATTPLGFVDALAEGDTCDGLPLYRDAEACLDALKPEVVVDFTNAAWTPPLAKVALERGVSLVIGTTGLTSEFLEELGHEAAARKVRGEKAVDGGYSVSETIGQTGRDQAPVGIAEFHHRGVDRRFLDQGLEIDRIHICHVAVAMAGPQVVGEQVELLGRGHGWFLHRENAGVPFQNPLVRA